MKQPFTKFFAILFIGLLIFLIYLCLTVGVNEISNILNRLNLRDYMSYYAMAIMAVFLSVLFYSMSWNKLMETLGIKIGLKKVYLYCWLGVFVDSVIPFETVSGEITRAFFVQRETNEQPGKIVASIVAHRIILTFITLSSLIISSILLIITYGVSISIIYPLVTLILCSVTLLILLLLVSLRKGIAEKIIDPILDFIVSLSKGRINLPETRSMIYMNLQCFYNDFRHLSGRRWRLILAMLYNFLAWLLHLSVFFLTFYAINFPEISSKIYETIIVYSINMALQTSPISLAPGLIEIVTMNLYALLGFNMAISGTATLFIRVATFWLPVIFGGIIAQWVGVKNLLTQTVKATSTC
ncbi:MAG: lysylphosphatidylglycerol synthase transmembrane domain-containing protein [Candidatus Bathyarchaeia archaeon]